MIKTKYFLFYVAHTDTLTFECTFDILVDSGVLLLLLLLLFAIWQIVFFLWLFILYVRYLQFNGLTRRLTSKYCYSTSIDTHIK